jgi:hypothetical protein
MGDCTGGKDGPPSSVPGTVTGVSDTIRASDDLTGDLARLTGVIQIDIQIDKAPVIVREARRASRGQPRRRRLAALRNPDAAAVALGRAGVLT